jgi:hypothetical protein
MTSITNVINGPERATSEALFEGNKSREKPIYLVAGLTKDKDNLSLRERVSYNADEN